MSKSTGKRNAKPIRMQRFGAVSALLFADGGGSAEIALAPLEFSRMLHAWEEVESSRKTPDERILGALRLLTSKARAAAPHIVVEVPIAMTRRVLLTPDFKHDEATS
ncbi:MAG TPA: hypothetical protein VGR47_06725 [Terracidiphilus sp.]|nr:hypothetical protein [Terracidiphilus sp.]